MVFFTGGVGLNTWAKGGTINRELELYKRLSPHLRKISLVTYGGRADLEYIPECGDLSVYPTPWLLNAELTKYFVYNKYYSALKQTDLYKTNQIPGSEIPVWIKKKLKKKLIVRCGYLYSDAIKKDSNDFNKIARAIALERRVFIEADAGVVTSNWQREIILKEYQLPPEKVKVIPNYVLTDLFTPKIQEPQFDLIYVGRCSKEKNIDGLLNALKQLREKGERYSLLMVGNCRYDRKVRLLTSEYKLDVTFQDNVPNTSLPAFLNKARVYILPSFHEGHPKALLEAMSCGLPCIGTNVQGIREDIRHEETGYLCGTEPMSISAAVHDVLSDEGLQKKLGSNSRQYILDRYSIDIIVQKELRLIEDVMSG